jgi:hypothetical protein
VSVEKGEGENAKDEEGEREDCEIVGVAPNGSVGGLRQRSKPTIIGISEPGRMSATA